MDCRLHVEILSDSYFVFACDLLRKEGEASSGLWPELSLVSDI